MTSWVYARSWSAWNMSWRSLFGGLPKAEIVCGECLRHSKTPADHDPTGRIYVWCPWCGRANILRGATLI